LAASSCSGTRGITMPMLADAHAFVLCSRPMPTNSRRRSPPATPRRALELLAASRDGVPEAILLAHRFSIELLVKLVDAGLATASAERMLAGRHPMEVTRVRITDAGRRALAEARP
jgi:hypothetical protein